MYFHKIWTWDWQDWHSSVFSVQVHITFPSRSTLKKLPDDNKSDCYVTSWRTIWLSQVTFERCGVRRGGGRHVPGGNLKKPLTMMGLATVAVTTLRTLARLHTAHWPPPATMLAWCISTHKGDRGTVTEWHWWSSFSSKLSIVPVKLQNRMQKIASILLIPYSVLRETLLIVTWTTMAM